MAPTAPGKKTAAEATAFIDKMIQEHKVMVFSKSYCPFCNRVKALFQEINQTFESIELDLLEDEWGFELQEALIRKSKLRTFPNVFINQQHIGGCDTTFAYHKSGQLKAILKS